MRSDPVIVLKLGGSVLSGEDALPRAVHEVYRWRREGYGVVAVVSALAGETNALLARTGGDGEPPPPHALAALAALGEQRAAALLGLHLERAGVSARVLSPATLRLVAQGDPLDALPVGLDPRPLRRALADGAVAVVPGFFAHDADGHIVLLGRGGSDLSALFLAARLQARCRLVKDVDGLYARDPALPGPPPARYAAATWDDALATDGSIVQHKALIVAQSAGRPFEIAGLGNARETLVGAPLAHLEAVPAPAAPLRVALLGLGTVGGGVLVALRRLPECFEVVAACARDRARPRPGLPSDLPLHDDAVATASCGADVVVECLGGLVPARSALGAALRSGAHVVTTNKAVLAAHGAELERLAAANGVSLRASAAAGGAMPLLPALRRLARTERIAGLEAVLNGTTTCVLDQLARGASPEEALEHARRLGLCERKVQRDLSGRDAADKLVLACHAATGRWIDPRTVTCVPIGPAELARARAGAVLRQVATLRLDGARPLADVRPVVLDPAHPLARTRGAGNAALLRTDAGRLLLEGRGAGRWPTVEAVVADLLDLARDPPRRRPRACRFGHHHAAVILARDAL